LPFPDRSVCDGECDVRLLGHLVGDGGRWEGVNKSLEEALAVFPHRKLSMFWGTIKNREDRKY